MPARFLVVPQWQGSGSSRAMRLTEGANAVLGDLPASVTRVVEIPMEAGEALDTGVHRFSSVALVRDRAEGELRQLDGVVITIGGDCGADLASVQHAASAREPGSMALLWFDAHPDLHDVGSSDSGAFAGMVLRAIVGDGPAGLASLPGQAVSPSQVVLAGTRAIDDIESAFIDEHSVRVVPVDDLMSPAAIVDAVAATNAASVYIHVDLDVIDPASIDGVGYPEPFGVTPDQLCDAIRAVRARFELAGGAITEFAPESADAAARDLPVILRLLGALTSKLA